MTRASSGSDRKIISRAIGQILLGISDFFLIRHKQCTKNYHYFKSCHYYKGPFLYYVRVEGWVGGIAKYLLFLTGVGGWFWIIFM